MPALVPRESAPQSLGIALRSLVETVAHPVRRQQQQQPSTTQRIIVPGVIPSYYRADGPSSGTVAGIVLGSVAGFMLIVWLLWSLTQGGGGGAAIAGEEEIVVRRRDRSPRSRRSHRSSRPEVREYSRSPRSRAEHVIVEDRRPPRPRSRSIIVEERTRVPGDDVVEVIEEHEDYSSRRGSRRSGGSYRY